MKTLCGASVIENMAKSIHMVSSKSVQDVLQDFSVFLVPLCRFFPYPFFVFPSSFILLRSVKRGKGKHVHLLGNSLLFLTSSYLFEQTCVLCRIGRQTKLCARSALVGRKIQLR